MAARIGFSYNLTAMARRRPEGRSTAATTTTLPTVSPRRTPPAQRYVEYNFNDLNGNGKCDGVSELGTFRARLGGADAPVDPGMKTPHTDEISATYGAPVLGRVVDPRHLRAEDAAGLTFPSAARRLSRHWVGQLTVPKTATVARRDLQPDRRAEFARRQDRHRVHQLSRAAISTTTRSKSRSRSGSGKAFFQTSGDYAVARRAAVGRHSPTGGSTSPLSTDPIGVGPQLDA